MTGIQIKKCPKCGKITLKIRKLFGGKELRYCSNQECRYKDNKI
jgi:ssDNA-binding Zn-finger/Zn-ribbon topoisomerase 1